MKRLVLIDGNNIVYRAYFGTAYTGNVMRNSQGVPTNAVYTLANMINKTINELRPDYLLVAFDSGKATFRHKQYDDYKAGRSKTPDELITQLPLARELMEHMGIKWLESDEYEADDIIGSYSKFATSKDLETIIISSDKDLLQLINKNTVVNLISKGDFKRMDEKQLKEDLGISPLQIIDLKALEGDKSDNIPGVPKVGQKTALTLLSKYDTLDGIYANIENEKGKLRENLENNKDLAYKSQDLATIYQDMDIEFTLEDLSYDGPSETLAEFYTRMEFTSLLNSLSVSVPKQEIQYKYISTEEELSSILDKDSYFHIETFNENYHDEKVLLFGLVNDYGNYVIDSTLLDNSMEFQLFLSSKKIKKYVFDSKKTIVILNWLGYEINNVEFDMLLASYIIDPSISKEDMKFICNKFAYHNVDSDEIIYGKGKSKQVPELPILSKHVVSKTLAIKELMDTFTQKLQEDKSFELYHDLELPLAKVLANMEFLGVSIDKTRLADIKVDLESRLSHLTEKIYELAGEEFNIASPKQLGVILFEKLELPALKKTKTGYSTNAEVLDKLRSKHEIIEYILLYRQLSKLLSTYVVGLNDVVMEDGKIHTIFKQALTQTGRLSSIEPNLQNIPIKTEEGRLIRTAFVPSRGKYLLACDYSQVELRVLASMSNCATLINAFNNGEDIHEATARLVFETDTVTSEMRRKAKVINFGIIYGMSDFGLSDELKISIAEAKEFRTTYLSKFPEVSEFMNEQIEFCTENGYVQTLLNRRRFVPEITSSNKNIKEFGKRVAMNAPIQGTAADILKIAMINIEKELNLQHLKSKMLITVHDEVVVETFEEELDQVIKIISSTMENAYELKVPLKVEYNYGKTWFDAK